MKRGRENDVVTVSFVDRKYQIQHTVLKEIPRFDLILQQNPDVEHIHMNELDLGATATLLQLHDVPRVSLPMMDPNQHKEDKLYDIFKELISTEGAYSWKLRLYGNNMLMLAFDICVIDDCNTFDVDFVGNKELFLIKKVLLNQYLGYHKRLVQMSTTEIRIVERLYGAQLYLFTCEACFHDFRVFFCLRYQQADK